MFENVGATIKKMAAFLCLIGLLGSLIIGIVLIANSDKHTDNTVPGIIVIFGGFFVSILSSSLVYGFGELILRVTSIDKKLGGGQDPGDKPEAEPETPEQPVIADGEENVLAEGGWKCPDCGNLNSRFVTHCVCGRNRNDAT